MKKLLLYRRFIALIYDIVLQITLIFIVMLGIKFLEIPYLQLNQFNHTLLMSGIGFLLYIIFFGILPFKLKGTIGKYFADVMVVATKGKFTIGRWIFRELVFKYLYFYIGIAFTVYFIEMTNIFLYLLFFISFGFLVEILFIIVKKEALHNYYLKTSVVKREIDIE